MMGVYTRHTRRNNKKQILSSNSYAMKGPDDVHSLYTDDTHSPQYQQTNFVHKQLRHDGPLGVSHRQMMLHDTHSSK